MTVVVRYRVRKYYKLFRIFRDADFRGDICPRIRGIYAREFGGNLPEISPDFGGKSGEKLDKGGGIWGII